jgi:hypothetical protein
MILAGVAFLLILLRWATISSATFGIASAGFGLFVGLIAAVVSGVAGFLVFRSSSSRTTAQ